jgi:hypothetical protein
LGHDPDLGPLREQYQLEKRAQAMWRPMWNSALNVLLLCLLAGVAFVASATRDDSKTSADPLAGADHSSKCSVCRLPAYGQVGEASKYGPTFNPSPR